MVVLALNISKDEDALLVGGWPPKKKKKRFVNIYHLFFFVPCYMNVAQVSPQFKRLSGDKMKTEFIFLCM